jgi:type I restriction enzyme R subunit
VGPYRQIVAPQLEWHGHADDEGSIKVVMTGSASDPLAMQRVYSSRRGHDPFIGSAARAVPAVPPGTGR